MSRHSDFIPPLGLEPNPVVQLAAGTTLEYGRTAVTIKMAQTYEVIGLRHTYLHLRDTRGSNCDVDLSYLNLPWGVK